MKSALVNVLVFLAMILCCALPVLLIFGGATLLTGVFLQQIAMVVVGLLIVAVVAVIFVNRKRSR